CGRRTLRHARRCLRASAGRARGCRPDAAASQEHESCQGEGQGQGEGQLREPKESSPPRLEAPADWSGRKTSVVPGGGCGRWPLAARPPDPDSLQGVPSMHRSALLAPLLLCSLALAQTRPSPATSATFTNFGPSCGADLNGHVSATIHVGFAVTNA